MQAQARSMLNPPVIAEATSIEETGLDLGLITELLLKTLYARGSMLARDLVEELCLPYVGVLERALTQAKREELVEITGSNGIGELAYRFALTARGLTRAQEMLERNGYVGPAPVTIQAYREVVLQQSLRGRRVTPADIHRALAELVLDQSVIDALGQALNSGQAIFLFGKPGNGKTALAQRVAEMFGGEVLIPYAVIADGQIIRVFDRHHHHPVGSAPHANADRRWVLCKRPAIMVGGELTLEALDLIYEPHARVYEAPLQMRANNGVLLIDDFGRQQISPRALLNRWIVPLEQRVDFLTLHTGKQLEIPFEGLLIFSTNLRPTDLVDEAFLRRIPNKIHIGNPSVRQFALIFQRQCQMLGIPFDQQGLAYLLRTYYVNKRELRACHPRDILRALVGAARYLGQEPRLTPELIDRACHSYFVDP
ncbi:ATP-binding protein [Thermomicrobiaceae bacterium CFH 74404]|uniref:ATP-binding protein n=1 Tax=Thermalbibacter longus TaxID=2951981 RepID=A0AA41WFG0_9BACT|nr:ATP-binding protein [Thermalbibacter longus]MCM8749075.1 ATP-binding protein [Thermalbibacter longus]